MGLTEDLVLPLGS